MEYAGSGINSPGQEELSKLGLVKAGEVEDEPW